MASTAYSEMTSCALVYVLAPATKSWRATTLPRTVPLLYRRSPSSVTLLSPWNTLVVYRGGFGPVALAWNLLYVRERPGVLGILKTMLSLETAELLSEGNFIDSVPVLWLSPAPLSR